MIYTAMTKKAMQIAYQAHAGQTDKSGVPYIFHPVHVAEQMPDEDTTAVALLHDVVEDTDMTLAQLESEGFPPRVLRAVELLTHEKGVDYMDYVRAIKADPIARAVKLADIRHNRDASRLEAGDPRAKHWEEKYKNAFDFLAADDGEVQAVSGFRLKLHIVKRTVHYPDDFSTTFHHSDEYCPIRLGEELIGSDTLRIRINQIIEAPDGGAPRIGFSIVKQCFEISGNQDRPLCRTKAALDGLKGRLKVTDAGLNCSDYFTQTSFDIRIEKGEYVKEK